MDPLFMSSDNITENRYVPGKTMVSTQHTKRTVTGQLLFSQHTIKESTVLQ